MDSLHVPQLRILDVGVADVNHDGKLDVFTTAHSYVSSVMENDGDGNFHDATTRLGLDEDPEFPGLEEVNELPNFG